MTDWHNSHGSGPFPIVERADVVDLVERADAALDRAEKVMSGLFCALRRDKNITAQPSPVNSVSPSGAEITSC